MPAQAAIFIQRGAPEPKQTGACLDYIVGQRWNLKHVVPYWSPDAAVALVRDGAVGVIVAAFNSKALALLAADIGDTGEVMYVHPQPTVVRPHRKLPSIGDLVRRLRGRGESTQEIAGFLEIDTGEVRRFGRDCDG